MIRPCVTRRPGFAEAAAVSLLVAGLATIAAAAAPTLGNVRLAGGPNARQGQLQVEVGGQWVSAVCQMGRWSGSSRLGGRKTWPGRAASAASPDQEWNC